MEQNGAFPHCAKGMRIAVVSQESEGDALQPQKQNGQQQIGQQQLNKDYSRQIVDAAQVAQDSIASLPTQEEGVDMLQQNFNSAAEAIQKVPSAMWNQWGKMGAYWVRSADGFGERYVASMGNLTEQMQIRASQMVVFIVNLGRGDF
jgi:hypothetical protein